MEPENNDLNHEGIQPTTSDVSQTPNSNTQVTPPVAPVSPTVTPNPTPLNTGTPNPISTINPVTNTPPVVSDNSKVPGKKKKPMIKYIIAALILILLVGGVAALAYHEGKSKRLVVIESPPQQPINLPPNAIVTASCVPGRGKQYIIPKDIPEGPIYDVYNGKVIAIEYVLGIQQLLTNSSSFSSTILYLTKNYQVDHFDVVPAAPQSGQTDEYIHLIMFVVSSKVADSITCGTTSTSTAPAT